MCATTTTPPHHRNHHHTNIPPPPHNHHHTTPPRQHTLTPPHHRLETTAPPTTAAAVCRGGNALDSFRTPAATRTGSGCGVHCGCPVPAQAAHACRSYSLAYLPNGDAGSGAKVGLRRPTLLAVQAVHLARNTVQRATRAAVHRCTAGRMQHAPLQTGVPAALRRQTIGRQGPAPAPRIHSVMNRESVVMVWPCWFCLMISPVRHRRRSRRSIRLGAPSA